MPAPFTSIMLQVSPLSSVETPAAPPVKLTTIIIQYIRVHT
ncbi:hypothetical protein S101395_04884 [Bacillus sonorensis]|uniref:Uncharacterized protein n=1 Tax=Bacillus sonorensis TaxID=119858 RepID=A0ABM6LPJ4_9BACI|nr:hypothetical protein S101395_04884 [Bacillus sonorensis]